MEVVPNVWLLNEGCQIKCLWPNKIKNTTDFTKMVFNKTELSVKDCILCPVEIKFKSGKLIYKFNIYFGS